jgi:tetratricopeptide (TPR) repeat protein
MHLEQGAALVAGGRFHEALQQFAGALRADPVSIPARIGMAQACAGTGDALTAAAWLSDACRIAPADPRPEQLLGELLLAGKQHAQALPVYRHLYSALNSRDRATLLHLGLCLEQGGLLDEAAQRYREAIAVEPDFLEAHVDLAGLLWRLGDFDGSLAHARKAVAIAPAHPYAVRILGTALLHLNRVAEAEQHLRHALQLQPGLVLAEMDLAFALLLAGRLEDGWRWYEKRWRDPDRLQRPSFFNPALEWKGPRQQDPAGKTIAVYAEQGLGDVIQFLRYLPLLQRDGANVVAVVQPPLLPLVQRLEGVVCYTPDRTLQADWHVALMELPQHYATTLDKLPAAVPYLGVAPETQARWRERLQPWQDKLKVGLCWAGHAGQVNNRNRSVWLSHLMPLLGRPGVQCFSLQKADAGSFTDVVPEPGRLLDFTGEWNDFGDSAAMLGELDLVITVDTAIAHLAGALGRPTWVLLAPNADWRWLLEREDSPWYPTMRLFRRGFEEVRNDQVARVVAALERFP